MRIRKLIKRLLRLQSSKTRLAILKSIRRDAARERRLDACRMSPDFSDYLEKSNAGMRGGSFRRTH